MNPISKLLDFLKTLYYRKKVRGKIVATETVVSDGFETVYQFTVKNTGNVVAKYKCILFVDGIDTREEYRYTSGWSDRIHVGRFVDIYVRVLLPNAALPCDKEEVTYAVFPILRAAD